MRWVTQIVVIAGLACLGAGGWYAYQQGIIGARQPSAAESGRRGGPAPVVEYVPARVGTVTDALEAVGTARANEAVVITAKQAGIVSALGFEEGQRVKAGQALVELEAVERRADRDQARAMVDDAKRRLDRARQLKTSGNVTEARLDELESLFRATEARERMAQARLDELKILAPFDGRVGMRSVSLGALVQPGTTVTTLDDIARIRLEFAVPEVALGRLKPGLMVTARSPAFPDREFRGEITVIDTRVDPATRSVKSNALIDNADEALKPGLFLNVALVLEQRDDAVLVPEEAIVPEAGKQFLFVVTGERVVRREVKLGIRLAGEVEVREGAKVGDWIVARGVQKIRDQQTVTPRPLRPQS